MSKVAESHQNRYKAVKLHKANLDQAELCKRMRLDCTYDTMDRELTLPK